MWESASVLTFVSIIECRHRLQATIQLMGEFDLIARFFTRPAKNAVLGVGDDCALLPGNAAMQCAVSCDMLVEGRHFLSTVAPERLGHKALAVNLSDLAACGAKPRAFLLALAMPRVDEVFLQGFSNGLFALADEHGIDLVGGDTTAGPLNICITVLGDVPQGAAFLRSGASVGDDVYVSGNLGDARLALEVFRGALALEPEAFEAVRRAMEMPQPRNVLALKLRGLISSAIDVSDGFLGDFTYVLRRSSVGATINVDVLPRSAVLAQRSADLQRLCTLAGGDDYELVFTAPLQHRTAIAVASMQSGVPVTCVGCIEAKAGLRLIDKQGHAVDQKFASFDHFKS